ncbi:hypothetical protein [Mesoflavibacter sp. CH_XMU1422-2]|uniref:hypothetical protein n=1 Tax=Mesoflavibacter sp. CH_XMU1422-2 TaxID=3107770 RepID=UPI00300A0BDA
MEKIKNYLKLGIFLICLSLFLWNCTLDEKNNDFSKKENQITSINTVSFEDAIFSFNSKKGKTQNTNARLNEDVFTVTPDWNSLQYTDAAYTDADLTTANSSINRDGNYQSQLHFINVNNVIKSVVFTIYKDNIDNNGNVIDGRIFFNDLNGRFLDGYVIENGLFTERYVVQSQTQQASLFPFMLLQESNQDDCWNTDNLDMFGSGVLDTVDLGSVSLTTTGNEDGGGTEVTGGYSDSYNWYYSSGTSGGDTTLGNYLNNASGGNTLPSGQGGTGLSSGQINTAASAVLIAMPIQPDEDGSCPQGYTLNPITGVCEFKNIWTDDESAHRNLLCGNYTFTSVGNASVANISGLGVTLTQGYVSLLSTEFTQSLCVTIPNTIPAHASGIFNNAWNLTMAELLSYLNLTHPYSNPTEIEIKNIIMEFLNQNIKISSSNVLASVSQNPCLGSIPTTVATYCP